MTEIEQKALALVNEVLAESDFKPHQYYKRENGVVAEALCRAIEQHEAFRQEVSDAVEDLRREWPEVRSYIVTRLSTFIIPKPVDPLVEAIKDCHESGAHDEQQYATDIRTALAKRGYEIREKAGD